MRNRSLLMLTAIAAAGTLTLSACGSRAASGASGSSSASSATTVTIGVDAPLTGPLSALGLGIRNSVDLAIKTANKTNEVPGITFKIEATDDKASPQQGQQNATTLVADSNVVGVVGPLNSGVAVSMQKIFDEANLVEVSPANTNPSLTQGPSWGTGTKVRQFKSYFRTATTDAIQGPFAAQFVYTTLAKKKVFLVDNKLTYGVGLVATFKDEFTKLGGTVAGQDHVTSGASDYSSTVTAIKASGADVVYFGGEYPDGAPLAKQLKAAGYNGPVVGGDGMKDDTFIKLAGTASEGDYATSVGAPVESLDSAKTYIANYKAGGYTDPYAAYGGYSYDSAWSIIEAVKAVAAANNGKLPANPRQAIETAMAQVSFSGVTGQVSFDQYGDATNKQLTVYGVKSGQWATIKTGTFSG
ncbi:branched-chain amino acid ABC transporter substrate-binding protein [Streptacidiphilus jiangxiensis]|uniref:Branched-chain amino acid transport system substrate-binding protein n=1 Tax=Streptacidiphilus jiangxiensis TaxID=235985 RepID=A0A1H7SIG8_STRJI|nr:branched-chain amino acid ABC transporter substrate-binding protein [Streptacidiphilus jiangxiensis]SEL72295.1 branched-chain amino acid transport system substrate-binding protein [Streptacidiphilus jiangxiensis]